MFIQLPMLYPRSATGWPSGPAIRSPWTESTGWGMRILRQARFEILRIDFGNITMRRLR